MAKPEISVIISGGAASLAAQTFRDFEIIEADNRNRGLADAQGRYVAFLNARDQWHPRKLETQLAQLKADNSSTWCYCEAAGAERALPSGRILRPLLLQNFIPSSSVIARRDIFRDMDGFKEPGDTRSAEWDMWLRLAERFPVELTPEPLVKLHSQRMASEESHASQLRVIEEAFTRNQDLRDLRAEALAGICVSTGAIYLTSKEKEAARVKFEEALTHEPLCLDAYLKWIASFFSLSAKLRPSH